MHLPEINSYEINRLITYTYLQLVTSHFFVFKLEIDVFRSARSRFPTSKKINTKFRKMYTRFYIVRLTWTNILQSFGILLINICMYIVETNIVLFWGPTLIFYLCFHKFKITLMFIKIWQDITRISVATIYKASPLSLSFIPIIVMFRNMEPFIRFSLLQQRKWVKEAEKSTKYPLKRLGGQKIPIKLPLTLKHDI